MTIIETVLVFVCIPLAVIATVFAIVYGSSAARSKRYRPGRPFTSAPVWFLAEKELTAAGTHAPAPSLVSAGYDSVHHGEVGGASDSW